jgi:hypothetical protein
MKIFTSVPPRFSRRHPIFGWENGRRHLERCIASWRRNGFTPISVNRPEEVDAIKSMHLIEVLGCPQDNVLIAGKYGVSLGSIFDAVGRDEPVAIVNADIYMRYGADLAEEVARLSGDAMLVARRTDVRRLGSASGVTFPYGHDFVAFTPSRIADAIDNVELRRFQLGVPWWDYVFPILAAQEVPVLRVKEPFIVHQLHDERWNDDLYRQVASDAHRTLTKVNDAYLHLEDDGTKAFADSLARISHRLLFYPGIPEITLSLMDSIGRASARGRPYWRRRHGNYRNKLLREVSRINHQRLDWQRQVLRPLLLE